MDIHLKIAGSLLIVLALVHFLFPRYFNWRAEFSSLSLVNRQMFYIHCFFIALVVFLMGILCITSAHDLVNTVLGKRISFGLAVFWLARLIIQFLGYSSTLWRGKALETAVHMLLSLFWLYLTTVFILSYFA